MAHTPTGATVWLSVMRAYFAMSDVAEHSMVEAGLGVSDFMLLEVLAHVGPSTPAVIGRKVRLTSGSVTAAVDRLAVRGLVERSPDPDDGRGRIVSLTDVGRALLDPAYDAQAADLERLVATALTPQQRSELMTLLRALRRAAEGESA